MQGAFPRIKAVSFLGSMFTSDFKLILKPQLATDFILIAYLNIVHSISVTQSSFYTRLTMAISHIQILIHVL